MKKTTLLTVLFSISTALFASGVYQIKHKTFKGKSLVTNSVCGIRVAGNGETMIKGTGFGWISTSKVENTGHDLVPSDKDFYYIATSRHWRQSEEDLGKEVLIVINGNGDVLKYYLIMGSEVLDECQM